MIRRSLGDLALQSALELERMRQGLEYNATPVQKFVDYVLELLAKYEKDTRKDADNFSYHFVADKELLAAFACLTGKEGRASFMDSRVVHYNRELTDELYAEAFRFITDLDHAVHNASETPSRDFVTALLEIHKGTLRLRNRSTRDRRYLAA